MALMRTLFFLAVLKGPPPPRYDCCRFEVIDRCTVSRWACAPCDQYARLYYVPFYVCIYVCKALRLAFARYARSQGGIKQNVNEAGRLSTTLGANGRLTKDKNSACFVVGALLRKRDKPIVDTRK